MFEIRTSVDIDASAEQVWAVISDFAAYPQWNPFVRRIHGWPERGQKLHVEIAPPGGKVMCFRPRVLEAVRPERLSWLGRVVLPGLFDGEHHFFIEQRAEGGIRFHHGERFRGLLVPFLKKSLQNETHAGFEAMNQALKQRVEAQQGE
jgi:hypothetical protein